MTKDSKTSAEVSAIMSEALFVLQDLVNNDAEYEMDYHQVVTLFRLSLNKCGELKPSQPLFY